MYRKVPGVRIPLSPQVWRTKLIRKELIWVPSFFVLCPDTSYESRRHITDHPQQDIGLIGGPTPENVLAIVGVSGKILGVDD